ncbi:tetratricopeptide repeat protein, partial [Leptospira borgpetersenii]
LNMPPLVFEGSTSRVTPETLQNIMKPAVEKSAITAGVDNSITSLYNRAHTLVNVGKHTDAMVIYKDLLNRTDFKFDSERKLVENSLFQLSVCLLKQNDLDSANSSFSTYIKKYPSGESIKESLFHLAEISELQGDRQRARMLYGKVALLPPEKDSISQKSKLKAKEMST